jgi:fatty acid desaturase
VYNDRKDFASAQLVSTRNIHFGLFNNWFTGGLNMQIEHHLFPTMPRHNLHKAAAQVEAFCQRNSLVYEVRGSQTGKRTVTASSMRCGALRQEEDGDSLVYEVRDSQTGRGR